MTNKSSNKNLRKASQAKKDEFYTQLSDIENELKHYKDQFRGKVVFCNCDDPKESNFVKYFSMNFEHLGLKKLIATHYKDANLFTKEAPYKLEYTGDKNGNRTPDPSEFMKKMIGTGDFRSEECIKLLKEADIVVTNPPFSLFREYVAQLIEYRKKFLIMGNQNAITYKEIFKLIKENKMWLGQSLNGKNILFEIPDYYESYYKIIGGKKYAFPKGVVWFTNLDVPKRSEEMVLYKKYIKKDYPTYDNYDAINIDRTEQIPLDYAGGMGVPITFLHKYNPKQFEILDGLNRYSILFGPTKETRGKYLAQINGKPIYVRIVIKNKKVKK
ncbi:MAG: adenine-specific methyltransferase EcoRI family protein [Patescibacteria group bacterium]|jgi:hypothetical protein